MTSGATATDPINDNGPKLVDLIYGSPGWIHRRVERLEILPTGDCIHHHSLDLTVPETSRISGSRGRVLVPLGFMKKGPLSRFNVSGPDGPISLLETDSNARLAVEFLQTLADRTYGPDRSRQEGVEALLGRIVREAPDPNGAQVDALAELLAAGGESSAVSNINQTAFLSVASQLSENFVMVVELDEDVVDQRTILKYSYLEERDDPHSSPRYELTWSLDDFGSASSFHFEIEPPALLGITRVTLTEIMGNEVHQRLDERPAVSAGKLANIAHRADRPSGRLASAVVTVELVPKRYGVVGISYSATIVVAAALTLILCARAARNALIGPIPVGSAAGSLLLATGGILLTWISRAPEDWMVAKILRDPRRHLVASASLLLAAACLMATPVPEPVRTGVWLLLAVLGWVVAAASWIYRRRSRVAPTASSNTPTPPLPS